MPITYDPSVDYSDLIAQEAAKGVNANSALLAQYEQQRNQKIADQGLNYAPTYIYSNGRTGSGGSDAGVYGAANGSISISNRGYSSAVPSGGYYTATDQSDYINQLYDAAVERAKAALQSEYEQQVAAFDAAEERIPIEYRDARNRASGDAAVVRANLNEQLAASGLNTGASGQARLAMSIAEQNNINDINRQQAEALASLQLQRTQAQSAYSAAVAEAIAGNDMERANALYQEAQRVDNSYRSYIEDALLQQQYTANNLQMDATRQQIQLAAQQAAAELAPQQTVGYGSGYTGGSGAYPGGNSTISRVDNGSSQRQSLPAMSNSEVINYINRIPGLTSENRAGMLQDLYNNGRITLSQAQQIAANLGFSV